jgi:hypothetical protein
MSLTSFLKIPKVKQRFAKTFPMPPFELSARIVSPPLTKHYTLVGTAFDYLMRFYLMRLNPRHIAQTWVAGEAINCLRDLPEVFLRYGYTSDQINRGLEEGNKIISQAQTELSHYLGSGKLTNKLIESALHLAQLDPIYRARFIDPNIGIVDKGDVDDLRSLISHIDPAKFKAKKVCILNPTFGRGSELVGGADCDLLLDDKLIDIKTTTVFQLKSDYYFQLIGYYILYKIGGIDGAPKGIKIRRLGVYFSRHAFLHLIPISAFTENPEFLSFVDWFKSEAKKIFSVETHPFYPLST